MRGIKHHARYLGRLSQEAITLRRDDCHKSDDCQKNRTVVSRGDAKTRSNGPVALMAGSDRKLVSGPSKGICQVSN